MLCENLQSFLRRTTTLACSTGTRVKEAFMVEERKGKQLQDFQQEK